MPSVQFLSWSDDVGLPASYPALRQRRQVREREVARLIHACSGIASTAQIQALAVQISQGNDAVMIPAASLAAAQEMASGLRALGATICLREMDNAARCEVCNRFMVVELDAIANGIKRYHCAGCSQLLHLCPSCDGQGWLRKYQAGAAHWYECDECVATWDEDWQSVSYNAINSATRAAAIRVRESIDP